MGNLDLLFEYQKADLELETFEQRIKSSPARQQLSKLRAHLVEQQSQWQRITADAEVKASSYEASLKRFEALLAQYEKRKLSRSTSPKTSARPKPSPSFSRIYTNRLRRSARRSTASSNG